MKHRSELTTVLFCMMLVPYQNLAEENVESEFRRRREEKYEKHSKNIWNTDASLPIPRTLVLTYCFKDTRIYKKIENQMDKCEYDGVDWGCVFQNLGGGPKNFDMIALSEILSDVEDDTLRGRLVSAVDSCEDASFRTADLERKQNAVRKMEKKIRMDKRNKKSSKNRLRRFVQENSIYEPRILRQEKMNGRQKFIKQTILDMRRVKNKLNFLKMKGINIPPELAGEFVKNLDLVLQEKNDSSDDKEDEPKSKTSDDDSNEDTSGEASENNYESQNQPNSYHRHTNDDKLEDRKEDSRYIIQNRKLRFIKKTIRDIRKVERKLNFMKAKGITIPPQLAYQILNDADLILDERDTASDERKIRDGSEVSDEDDHNVNISRNGCKKHSHRNSKKSKKEKNGKVEAGKGDQNDNSVTNKSKKCKKKQPSASQSNRMEGESRGTQTENYPENKKHRSSSQKNGQDDPPNKVKNIKKCKGKKGKNNKKLQHSNEKDNEEEEEPQNTEDEEGGEEEEKEEKESQHNDDEDQNDEGGEEDSEEKNDGKKTDSRENVSSKKSSLQGSCIVQEIIKACQTKIMNTVEGLT